MCLEISRYMHTSAPQGGPALACMPSIARSQSLFAPSPVLRPWAPLPIPARQIVRRFHFHATYPYIRIPVSGRLLLPLTGQLCLELLDYCGSLSLQCIEKDYIYAVHKHLPEISSIRGSTAGDTVTAPSRVLWRWHCHTGDDLRQVPFETCAPGRASQLAAPMNATRTIAVILSYSCRSGTLVSNGMLVPLTSCLRRQLCTRPSGYGNF